jgi:hypothetical protein
MLEYDCYFSIEKIWGARADLDVNGARNIHAAGRIRERFGMIRAAIRLILISAALGQTACGIQSKAVITMDDFFDDPSKYAFKIVDVRGEIQMDYHGPVLCDAQGNGFFIKEPDSISPKPDFGLEKDHLYDEYERLSMEVGSVQGTLGKAKLLVTLRGRFEFFQLLPDGIVVIPPHPENGPLIRKRFVLQRVLRLDVQSLQKKPKSNGDLYLQIPPNLREHFVRRLSLLIEYEKAHRWNDLYGLLYSGIKQNETIDRYSKRRKLWLKEFPEKQVLEFIPHSLRGPDNPATGEWFVFGCATKSEQGHAKKYEGVLNAYYEKDDWFFSEPQIIAAIDGPPSECDGSK